MNKKILITGGTGFIGSHVIESLLNRGYHPILIKRSFSDTWRIKEFKDKLTMYDIDKTSLDEIFKKEDINGIINLATFYRKINAYEDIDNMIDTNVKLPARLLELGKIYGSNSFVTAGTFFQYDRNSMIINESTPIAARDFYAATKNALERILEYYALNFNYKVFELILFSPYGEKDNTEKLIPNIIKAAILNKPLNLTAGFQKLNFAYVKDIASAFVKAIDAAYSQNIRINIANKELYSIREIITIIEELTGKNINVKFGSITVEDVDENQMLSVDTDLSKKLLGWMPKFNIYEGLNRTINYYRGEFHES
ncbi:MAG: NAD-dependent epimerase/dehydratase family protein [Caldisphaera sp.]